MKPLDQSLFYCSPREDSPPPEHSPPPKKTARKGSKKGPSQKSRIKRTAISSGANARKKRSKQSLGLTYVSPPSSPSPHSLPVSHCTTSDQHSPLQNRSHDATTRDPSQLLGTGCDRPPDNSHFLRTETSPHDTTACVSTHDRQPDTTGHPDISDLFLDPYSPSEQEHTTTASADHSGHHHNVHDIVNEQHSAVEDVTTEYQSEGEGNSSRCLTKGATVTVNRSEASLHNIDSGISNSVSIDDLFG